MAAASTGACRAWPQRVFPTRPGAAAPPTPCRALVGDDELWEALVERPLGELCEASSRDDTVRGIVATDALIGTFADLDEPSLRQNVCFLYHLIGGGTGDWDVPVGGMGAVTDGLARAAVGRRRRDRHRRGGPRGRPRRRGRLAARRAASTARRATSRPVWRPPSSTAARRAGAGAGRDRAGARGRPAQGQHAADPAAAAARRAPSTPRAAFAGTFHINEGYGQLEEAYAAAAAGAVPELPPCEIYCHSLSDRSILGPDLAAHGRADTDAVRAAPAGPAVPRGQRGADARRPSRPRCGRSTRCWPSRSRTCLLRDADGARASRQDAASTSSRTWPARRQHLPPLAAVALGREDAEVGTWGVETGHDAGAARRSRRATRWWGQRHTGPQRGQAVLTGSPARPAAPHGERR